MVIAGRVRIGATAIVLGMVIVAGLIMSQAETLLGVEDMKQTVAQNVQ